MADGRMQWAGEGVFAGYASLFGRADLGGDTVERGAFGRSIAKRGKSGIRMLFQHDPKEPIGAWEDMREDQTGLFVRGRLALGTSRGREVLSLFRAGALDGLSIGFRTVRAEADRRTGLRRIIEADLWEVSVVTFPMMPGARVSHVKGLAGADMSRLAARAAKHRINAKEARHDGQG